MLHGADKGFIESGKYGKTGEIFPRLFEKRKPLVRPGVQLSFSVESLI